MITTNKILGLLNILFATLCLFIFLQDNIKTILFFMMLGIYNLIIGCVNIGDIEIK